MLFNTISLKKLQIAHLHENQVSMEGVDSNFLARDPCREIFLPEIVSQKFPAVSRKTSLPKNSNKLLSNNTPASQLLSMNTFCGKKFRLEIFVEIRVEIFSRNLSCEKTVTQERC
jgi:hypothetical protein